MTTNNELYEKLELIHNDIKAILNNQSKIKKDLSGNYYQVCPSDNSDYKNCSPCPYNWKFEVDASGQKNNNSKITPIPNDIYILDQFNKTYNGLVHHLENIVKSLSELKKGGESVSVRQGILLN